jgi:DNA topoisomerase-2
MKDVGKPTITDLKEGATDFTRITWTPDLAKFGLSELDEDHCALFERRAYDLAGVARVKVSAATLSASTASSS